mmetsp:Transcript_79284/g.181717  ORF Transcript_79284/g.181717 Transcript_79284/m.181717 type:complete len:82 (+) Transcript_79284:627-872(+)
MSPILCPAIFLMYGGKQSQSWINGSVRDGKLLSIAWRVTTEVLLLRSCGSYQKQIFHFWMRHTTYKICVAAFCPTTRSGFL